MEYRSTINDVMNNNIVFNEAEVNEIGNTKVEAQGHEQDMNKMFYTKSELIKRWSNKLIMDFFPKCSKEKPNPYYKSGAPMQLYDVNKVASIESTDAFKADYQKVMKRKSVAIETAQRKREESMKYANEIKINIPTIKKKKLIQRACYHYNSWHRLDYLDNYEFNIATPSSEEDFLKRICINYLRHQCTNYDNELRKFYNKVGVGDFHDILQSRINNAIKQKYEWLR